MHLLLLGASDLLQASSLLYGMRKQAPGRQTELRYQPNIKLDQQPQSLCTHERKGNLQSWEIRLILLIVLLMLASINLKTHRVAKRLASLKSSCPNPIRMGIE